MTDNFVSDSPSEAPSSEAFAPNFSEASGLWSLTSVPPRLGLDVLLVCAMDIEMQELLGCFSPGFVPPEKAEDTREAGTSLGEEKGEVLSQDGKKVDVNLLATSPFESYLGQTLPWLRLPASDTVLKLRVARWSEPGSDKPALTLGFLVCGIGLAAAAASLAAALTLTNPARIIAGGTCGGLAASTNVKDVVAGDTYVFSTADGTAFDYAPGQVPGQPAVFEADEALLAAAAQAGAKVGGMASSDMFVTARNVDQVRTAFPQALGAEMESAALALVAHRYGVPFVAIRGVSDLCGPAADQDFHVDAPVAAEASATVIADVLSELA